jgi:hypothetical protein
MLPPTILDIHRASLYLRVANTAIIIILPLLQPHAYTFLYVSHLFFGVHRMFRAGWSVSLTLLYSHMTGRKEAE